MDTLKINREINVLIPDGEVNFSLHVISCLSEHKFVKIHLLSKFKWVETRFSRYTSSFTHYPDIADEKKWIEIIKKEVQKKKIDVLLPVHVVNIRLLSRYKAEFETLLPNFILPITQSFDIADDKWKLYKFLEKHTINAPLTTHLEKVDTTIVSKIKLPALLKPLGRMGGIGIKKITNKKALLSVIDAKDDAILQEYIKGFDIDMNVLCENGNILAHTIQQGYIYSRVPYSPAFGVQFLDVKEICKSVEKLMKALQWSGFAHIDLRFDENANNYKVIEVNPRVWGSVELSKEVGVNFPYLYCITSLGIEYEAPKYRFEKCVNNTGLIKVLKSKIYRQGIRYKFPENTIIKNSLWNPLPIIYRITIKKLKKIFLKDSKFLERFKYEIY